jgi:hypothetical protein
MEQAEMLNLPMSEVVSDKEISEFKGREWNDAFDAVSGPVPFDAVELVAY